MTVELSKQDMEIIEQALEVWEREQTGNALLGGMMEVMLTGKEHRAGLEGKFKSDMDAATQALRQRRVRSTLLRAKLYGAAARESEHHVEDVQVSHTIDKIAVMQAFENGAYIERTRHDYVKSEWQHDPDPAWNWETYVYQVKQTQHVWWFNVYTDGTKGRLWESREAAKQAVELGKTLARIVHVTEVE